MEDRVHSRIVAGVPRRGRTLLGLALSCALVAGACGDDEGSSSAPSSTAAGSAATTAAGAGGVLKHLRSDNIRLHERPG